MINDKQIKSKERVSDFGEVYTAHRQVYDMVNLVDTEACSLTSTFLEPACGNGNFLIEILRRKLKVISTIKNDEQEIAILIAVSTIYGIDIQNDNIEECRTRMKLMIEKYAVTNHIEYSNGFVSSFQKILSKNLICGDTLTHYSSDGNELKIVEWEFTEDDKIIGRTVLFSEMLLNDGESNHYIYTKEYNYMCRTNEIIA